MKNFQELDLDELDLDELDMMKEVSNICSGHAADALSKLLQKEVRVSIPSTKMLDYVDAMNQIGDAEQVVGGVMIELSDDVQGVMLFLYDATFANMVLEPLLGETIEDVTDMNEDRNSVIQEIGNIIIGSYASAMSKILDSRINLSVPGLTVNMLGGILSVPMAMMGNETNELLYSKTEFIVDGNKNSNWLVLVPNVASMNYILEKLKG